MSSFGLDFGDIVCCASAWALAIGVVIFDDRRGKALLSCSGDGGKGSISSSGVARLESLQLISVLQRSSVYGVWLLVEGLHKRSCYSLFLG